MRYFIYILLSISMLIPIPLYSQGIILKNIVLNAGDRDVSLQISTTFFNKERIESIIKKNQMQVVFNTDIKIEKQRSWFFDDTIYNRRMEFTILYDPIKNEYILKSPSKARFRADSFKRLVEKISIIRLNIPLWKPSKGRDKYKLLLKFSLKKRVPYWLEKTLFFWNFNLIPPVEYSIDFNF